MSDKEIKPHKQLGDKETYTSSPRAILYMAGVIAFLATVSTVGGYFKYKRYQTEQIQNRKDAQTEMKLIDQRTDIAPRAYTGVMFFSKTDQTNRADAVMHYATRNPETMEKLRLLKLGEKRKVSEWKGLVADKYIKNYSWSELSK